MITGSQIEGNELIAGFMLGKRVENYPDLWLLKIKENKNHYVIYKARLKYHKDYNWMFPVLDRIFLLPDVYEVNVSPNSFYIRLAHGKTFQSPKIATNKTITEIWVTVCEFLKWYNEEKKK